MNNFYIAPCLFSTTKLLRDSNKILEHLFDGYPIGLIFCVHSQCRSKIFLSGCRWNGMFLCHHQCRSSTYLGGVYVILILRAWQTIGGPYRHIYTTNISPKKERITCFYTHIPLLLTQFHLYQKIWHFAGIYTVYKWNTMKRRHSGKCKSKEGKEAQPENKTWANPRWVTHHSTEA
jgi:hypothetical protein